MVSCALHGLVIWGILGFFLAYASAQRAPNGSVGTIDFRYPDDIVSPRVECPFEGVFPHPRDCRWYYRCYDTFGYGFFWRAYFECEPGTAFSDTLDQCVFQGDGNDCLVEQASSGGCREELLGCREEDICAPSSIGTSFIYRTEVCSTALKVCLGAPNVPMCDSGYLFDTGKKECIEETAVCQPSTPRPESDFPLTCEDELSECADINLCFPGQGPRVHRFCVVKSYCYHQDGRMSTTSKCPDNHVFDVFENKCTNLEIIRKPENLCESNIGYIAPLQCVVESESCSVYQACETRESFLGCVSTFMCGAAAPRSSVCSYGAVFVPKTNRCIRLTSPRTRDGQPAGGIESPCTFTNIEPPALPPTPPAPSTPPTLTTGPTEPSGPTEPTGSTEPNGSTEPTGTPETTGLTEPTFATEPTETTLPTLPTQTTPPAPPLGPEYPPLPVGFDDVNDYISQYQCTALGAIPTAPRHSSLKCFDRAKCFPGGERKVYNVCQMFFVCDSYNNLVIRNCGKSKYFDYSSAGCKKVKRLPGGNCVKGTSPSTPSGSVPTQGGPTQTGTGSAPQGGPGQDGAGSPTPGEIAPASIPSPGGTMPSAISGPPSGGNEGVEVDQGATSDGGIQGATQSPSPVDAGTGSQGTQGNIGTPPAPGVGENGVGGSLPDAGTSPGSAVSPGNTDPEGQALVTEPLNISVDSVIKCRRAGEIALMDAPAVNKNCEKTPICNEGVYLRLETRCPTFYTCVLNPNLNPIPATCEKEGEVLILENKRCEVPTGKPCARVFYYWVSQRNAYELVENTPLTLENIYLQEKLRHNAQIQGQNQISQFQQSQNSLFPQQQQQPSFGLQEQPYNWNSGPQQVYSANFGQQNQLAQGSGNERLPHQNLNLQAPEPQQFGLMAQKHEQAPQPNKDSTFVQYPAVEQTLWQHSQIQQSGFPQPQSRPAFLTPSTLFRGHEFGDRGFRNQQIVQNRQLANTQSLDVTHPNAPQVNQFKKEGPVPFNRSHEPRFNDVRHHSNPGIPSQTFTAHQNVGPQQFAPHQSVGGEQSFSNRISGTQQLQHQPSTFQRPNNFLWNTQNPQNQVHHHNFI